jgi:hypothetical protein
MNIDPFLLEEDDFAGPPGVFPLASIPTPAYYFTIESNGKPRQHVASILLERIAVRSCDQARGLRHSSKLARAARRRA